MDEGDTVLAMVDDDARRGLGYGQDLRTAVEGVAIQHRPYRGTNAYELVPAEAADLRRGLFSSVLEGGVSSASAARALYDLDRLRDRYGAPLTEPRHPDLSSGQPWPAPALDAVNQTA